MTKSKYFKFVIPSITAMWVYSIYTLIDGFFVARFVSEKALAAVNISLPFISFLLAFAMLFAIGTQTVISGLIGLSNYKKANSIFTFVIVSIAIMMVIISIVLKLNIDSLVSFISNNKSLYPLSKQYLGIILDFAPFFVIAYILEVIVKVDSFPKMAMIVEMVSASTNIILDYVFVARLSMGIGGAAIATGFSQFIGTLIYIIHFLRKRGNLKFVKLTNHISVYPRVILLGFGDFLTELSTGIMVFLYNYFLSYKIGIHAIVIFTIINYFSLITTVTMQGISQGIQPLVSFYYAKKDSTYRKMLSYAKRSSIFMSVLFFVLVNIFAKDILSIFLNSSVALEDIRSFRLYSTSFLVVGFNLLNIGFLAAIRRSKLSIFISLLRSLIVISIVLFIMPTRWIFLSSFVSELITLLISLLILKRN